MIITVASGQTFWNLHRSGGWTGYAQQPPNYSDCIGCLPSGPGTTWAMYEGIKSPSLSGNSTQFNIGGTMDYSDVLWNNHLIGDLSSQGLPDTNRTLVPTLHNFTYDVWFYSTNIDSSQAPVMEDARSETDCRGSWNDPRRLQENPLHSSKVQYGSVVQLY